MCIVKIIKFLYKMERCITKKPEMQRTDHGPLDTHQFVFSSISFVKIWLKEDVGP